MIIKKHILLALKDLDREYNNALSSSNPIYATYFAKLAVLEYCGWVEESLDLIVKRSVKDKLKSLPFKQIHESVISSTFGFQYKEHFRPMMLQSIGIVRMETLHTKLEKEGLISILISELEAVKKDRNTAAHTWIQGVTTTYPSPSMMIGRLNIVYPILKRIYSEIIRSN